MEYSCAIVKDDRSFFKIVHEKTYGKIGVGNP